MQLSVSENFKGNDKWYRPTPALCLDLDGTVRKSKTGGFIASPEDIELIEGMEEQIWAYKDRGFLIIAVTNQGGVAHGHKSTIQVQAEHQASYALFKRNPFDFTFTSYAMPDGKAHPFNYRSLLRKPYYGGLAYLEVVLFHREIIVDWDRSVFVGDREEDQQCAQAAGLKFIWGGQPCSPGRMGHRTRILEALRPLQRWAVPYFRKRAL